MLAIILGVLIVGAGAVGLISRLARRYVKRQGESSSGSGWLVVILLYGVVFGAIGGAAGFGISVISPAPPSSVEERVVLENLLPFPQDNKSDPTIYVIPAYPVYKSSWVRYRDDAGIVKRALCCDGKSPKLTEEEGTSLIKRYHRPGYVGWFSIRLGSTWYEVYVPPKSVMSEGQIPVEILR